MKYDAMRIREEIARREQSVAEFARVAGVSQFTMYRALAGSHAATRSLGKIANALNLPPRELLRKGDGESDN